MAKDSWEGLTEKLIQAIIEMYVLTTDEAKVSLSKRYGPGLSGILKYAFTPEPIPETDKYHPPRK